MTTGEADAPEDNGLRGSEATLTGVVPESASGFSWDAIDTLVAAGLLVAAVIVVLLVALAVVLIAR